MFLFSPKPARAGRLGADVIALFPKEVGEFAYADLKKARTMKWFPQLQEQMLPERFRQFEKFLASAGVDPNSQVEELAWGLVAEGVNNKTEGAVRRRFHGRKHRRCRAGKTTIRRAPRRTSRNRSLPTFKARNYTLFAFGSGSGANDLFFFFVDSSTAAFGHRSLLEKMIEVRFGTEDGLQRNEKFFPLVNEANGSGVVWAVLNPAYTRLAMKQLGAGNQSVPRRGEAGAADAKHAHHVTDFSPAPPPWKMRTRRGSCADWPAVSNCAYPRSVFLDMLTAAICSSCQRSNSSRATRTRRAAAI